MAELQDLQLLTEQLAALAVDRPESRRAQRIAQRIASGRFHVAVVGEFKRGKSTLINALVGEEVVPMGVLPLTAVSVELSFGQPTVRVRTLDGGSFEISRQDLAQYVTETGNPGNLRRVDRVEVSGKWGMLDSGVVLVDTPGISSIYEHNTEAARNALLDADGAVLVFAADAPISAAEQELVRIIADRRSRTFFVVNKIDHLAPKEVMEVRDFVEGTLRDVLGSEVTTFCIDARRALARRSAGRGSAAGGEWDQFIAELRRFIEEELVGSLESSVRAELARLGRSLKDAIALERAARNLDSAHLAELVSRFSDATERIRTGFEDDRVLLKRGMVGAIDRTGERTAAFARAEARQHDGSLEKITETASKSGLVDALRDEVRSTVQRSFDNFRREELKRVEDEWSQIAIGFRARTQQRMDDVHQLAAQLFEVPLPAPPIPEIAEQRQRFTYLFIEVGSVTEPLARLLFRLLPYSWARRVALQRAKRSLVDEFDKHAGRTRWDLAQRVEEAGATVEGAMSSELDRSISAVLDSAARARRMAEDGRGAKAHRRGGGPSIG